MFVDLAAADLQPATIDGETREIILSDDVRKKIRDAFEEEGVSAKIYPSTSVVKPDSNYVFFSNHWYYLAVLCKKYAQALYPYCRFFDERIRPDTKMTADLANGNYDNPQFVSLFSDDTDKNYMIRFIKGDANFRPGKALINKREGNRVAVRSCRDIFGSCVLKKISVPDASSGYLGDVIYYLAKRENLFTELENEITTILATPMKHDEKESDWFTPEWFRGKAAEFPTFDTEAETRREQFLQKYNPSILRELEGLELLRKVFLNDENKDNLCYELEFDGKMIELFGSIKSGTSHKYGLFYSKKHDSWVTGGSRSQQFLSENEAIELGTQIRDYLVDGVDVLSKYEKIDNLEGYRNLYEELNAATEGYVTRVWFLKYYHMIAPDLFPPIYSQNAQTIVLTAIGEDSDDNSVVRMGQMQLFVQKCGISSALFSKIFWTYYENVDPDEQNQEEDDTTMENEPKLKNCLEVELSERTDKTHPLDFIVYGAPGTGKTYSTAEYALAIIEHRPVDLSKKSTADRKAVMKEYNRLISEGRIVFTTFHQSYGYEEFIQGLRPDTSAGGMSFKTVDGVFKQIADKALNDGDNNYVIIIDEINRANISKVFGELITLIEEDKRWGEVNETCATLQSGDIFAVPNNLYIVGTMNSADKSISLIDAALRRRFDFIEQHPDTSLVEDPVLRSVMKKLNELLADSLDSSDLLIGHSYFMGKSEDSLCTIMNNSIIPLLYEYFYDNKKKVIGVLSECLKDQSVKIKDNKISRVRVEKAETTE